MINGRIRFSKDGECKYISHLDLNRVMLRAVQKSGIEIWHTEGFNRHAYITFALPLSLGMSSYCETMDFRLLNDAEDMASVPERMNACLPSGIRVLSCFEQKHKPADIASAEYESLISPYDSDKQISLEELLSKIEAFLSLPEIMTEKKTKKGKKQIDLRPCILSSSAQIAEEGVRLTLTLPAGSQTNINPNLLLDALADHCGFEMYTQTERKRIMTKDGEDFV